MIGIAVAIFAVCCVLPVAHLIATSLTGLAASATSVALDARQRTLLYNTTLLGLGTAAFSTLIGAPLGLILARVPLKRKAAIRVALAAPMLLPPYVVALAWIHLANSRAFLTALTAPDFAAAWIYSLPAAISVLSLVFYPISMLASEMGLRRIDGRLEEAGLTVASPARVLWRISLPLAAPAIVAAALVVFVLAVSEFGVPALLRVRVYTTEVFTAFAALYDFSRAMVLAVPLLVLSAGVGAVVARLLGNRIVSVRRLMGTHPMVFSRWQGSARVAVAMVIIAAVATPIVVLAREAWTVRSIGAALVGSGEAIANSLVLAAVGATIVATVSLCLGYARARAPGRIANLVDILFVVLFAVPGTIVGVALIGLWNRPGVLGMVYGTDAMFILAYLPRFVPVAALILAAAIRSVPISHEEAAATAGASWLLTVRRIVVPQLKSGLSAAWIIVFVLSFGDLGASILIAPPGESTLPIRIYTLIANAPPAQVAVLALLQMLVIFAPLAVFGTVAALREGR